MPGKQNLSDAERQRRRERMLKLRERLNAASAPVPKTDAKAAIKAKKDEFVKAEAEKIRKEMAEKKAQEVPQEELESIPEEKPVRAKPAGRKPKAKPVSDSESDDEPVPKKQAKRSKPAVKKAIKIKYYGDVSPAEMENDAKFLQGLHSVDKSYEEQASAKKNQPKDAKMDRLLKEMGY